MRNEWSDAVYRQVLERPSNGEGASLVEQAQNGQASVREVVRSIARSAEHRQRFLTGNGESAVTYLYRHILGRAPDPDGLRTYVQALSRADTSSVVDTLINSPGVPGRSSVTMRSRVRGFVIAVERPVPRTARTTRTIRRAGCAISPTSTATAMVPSSSRNGTVIGIRSTSQDWNGDGVLSGEEVRPGARRAARAAENNSIRPIGQPGPNRRFDSSTATATGGLCPTNGCTAPTPSGAPIGIATARSSGASSLAQRRRVAAAPNDERDDRFATLMPMATTASNDANGKEPRGH